MAKDLILASESASRKQMLNQAGVPFTAIPAHIDETSILESMRAANATPRDIADALAETKALKISRKVPDAIVLGCDQMLECDGELFEKAKTPEAARETLRRLRGRKHRLISAAVIAAGAAAIWRHADEAYLTMRPFTDEFLETYAAQAGPILTSSVGAYALEGLGAQLFAQVRGDGFTIQGMPLFQVLEALRNHGILIR
jgi:septum formation protein